MLLLLKKIRREIITKSKFGSYLLYAVGEIVLVVVGILIAVKIDGLNKAAETREVTKTYLLSLKSEMESNKFLLQETMDTNEEVIRSCQRLANIIEHDSISYSKSEISELMSAFAPNLKLSFNVAVLGELISSGNIKNIENQKLGYSLTNFLPELEKIRFNEEILKQDRELCIDEIRKHGSFRQMLDDSGLSTEFLEILPGQGNNSNDALLTSTIFENNLLIFLINSISRQKGYESLQKEVDELILLIKEELKD